MKLTDIEFCRTTAFINGLRMMDETSALVHPLDDCTKVKVVDSATGKVTYPTRASVSLKALQEYTVDVASRYAKQSFPDLSFPDETEREIAPIANEVTDAEDMDVDREPTDAELSALEPDLDVREVFESVEA